MSDNVINSIDTSCYHCGEDGGSTGVLYDDKTFCCQGCKMVYSILKDNDLCNYYQLNQASGVSFYGRSIERYSHLDNQDVIDRIVDFSDNHRSRVHFYLPQIHCSSCLWLLENLNRMAPGVTQSRVDFLKKQVAIIFDPKEISLRKIVELLARLGYAPVLNFDKLDQKQTSNIERSLYYKIGLAGFSFGNIMLLSFPEYLGLDAGREGVFSDFFGYLSLLLILPVLLYSGQDYFKSAWQGLRQNHLNIDVPVSLGILALFGRSTFEILTHTGSGYLDSLAGLIFFLLIGKWFQHKAYHTISFDRDYKSYFPMATTLVKAGVEQSITLDKIEVGDEIMVRHDELIPADADLLEGEGRMDYSFVTGESRTISVDQGGKVFAGGRQKGGTITLRVTAKVAQSYLTSLWNEEAFGKKQQNKVVSKLADQVAKLFTWIILIVAIITLVYWLPKDMAIAFNAFTAVLIVACPCAVALSIPFTFGNVMRILGNNHFYLKNTGVVEAIANATHLVLDKTGTITTGDGATLEYTGTPLTQLDLDLTISLAHQSAHPKSRQIEHQLKIGASILPVLHYQSHTGEGIEGIVAGQRVMLGAHRFVTAGGNENPSGTWLCINDELKGCFREETTYRSGLDQVLGRLKQFFTLSMLSGDTAQEEPVLRRVFGSECTLRFNQSPHAKLEHIKRLQESKEVVMMIGDGLNDAGALKQADIGVAISEQVNNFIPACDAVLDASRFSLLPAYIRYCTLSVRIVYISYAIAFIYNVIGLGFAVQGLLSPVVAAILMPLSSITIVVFGMGVSTLMADRMGIKEKKEAEDDQGHTQPMTLVINRT